MQDKNKLYDHYAKVLQQNNIRLTLDQNMAVEFKFCKMKNILEMGNSDGYNERVR